METAITMSARSLQYYVIARRWASDLEFFKIETAFLHRLVDEYFIRMCGKGNFEKFKYTVVDLLKLETESMHAETMLTEQLRQVELMAEDIIPENAEDLAVNQVQLEYMMTNLSGDYRDVKMRLFAIIEGIIKENRLLAGLSAN